MINGWLIIGEKHSLGINFFLPIHHPQNPPETIAADQLHVREIIVSILRMASFQNMGIMCINGEIQGVCQHCLWLEWNPELKRCINSNTCFCPRQDEEQLLNSESGEMIYSTLNSIIATSAPQFIAQDVSFPQRQGQSVFSQALTDKVKGFVQRY